MIDTLLVAGRIAKAHWKAILAGAVIAALGLALLLAKADARHWAKRFESEQAAHKLTVANYRKAAAEAAAEDAANVARVQAEQQEISNAISTDYQRRLAELRARYSSLLAEASADPGGGDRAPVPVVPPAAGGPDAAASQDRLPLADALIASEQAIQLEALQAWVRAQAEVKMGGE